MSCFELLSEAWSNPYTIFIETIFGNRPTKSHFAAVDGLRALSFLWVFVSHLLLLPDRYFKTCLTIPDTIESIASGGYQGVTCFFVLSGFLVAYILSSAVDKNNVLTKNKYGGLTLEIFLAFLQKRFFRIAPSFYFSVFLTAFYPHDSSDNIFYNWPSYLIFINNYFSTSLYWSVAVEMQFYLISALPMYLYLSKPVYGFITSGIMIAIPLLIRTLIAANYANDFPKYASLTYFNMIARADAYGVGMLVFMTWEAYMKDRPSSLTNEYYLNPGKNHLCLQATMFIIWTLIFISILSIFFFMGCCSLPAFWPYSFTMYHNISMFSFACSTGSLILITLDGYISLINFVLSSPLWIPLASLSYTGYLLTDITINLYSVFYTKVLAIDNMNKIPFVILQYLCFALVIALPVTVFIEKPFIFIASKLF